MFIFVFETSIYVNFCFCLTKTPHPRELFKLYYKWNEIRYTFTQLTTYQRSPSLSLSLSLSIGQIEVLLWSHSRENPSDLVTTYIYHLTRRRRGSNPGYTGERPESLPLIHPDRAATFSSGRSRSPG